MSDKQAAGAIPRAFLAVKLFELGLQSLVHGQVHVAIHFDEAGEEQARPLDALDQRQFWLWLGTHTMPSAHGANTMV